MRLPNRNLHSPPQRLAVAGVLLSVLFVAGCPKSASSTSGSAAQPQSDFASHNSDTATQRKPAISALESVLKVFSGQQGVQWSAYDSVPGIAWHDAGAIESPGSQVAPFKRGGNLLLSGFGMVDVPNGKTGEEAGSRQDNEGNSGVTLLGTAERVNSVAVMKFYASSDYPKILRDQLGAGAEIEQVAGDCGAPGETDSEDRRFYRIRMADSDVVYAEIYVDAEGGKYSPGATTFEFYRAEPKDKIESAGCQSAGKD